MKKLDREGLEIAQGLIDAIASIAEFEIEAQNLTHAQRNGIAKVILHLATNAAVNIDDTLRHEREQFIGGEQPITTAATANPGDPDFPF